ncbi:unnamed protein product [Mytilus edulis]|uniref:Novel STAND NTPase 3 domain-containing protein n=1 Tax=Mytilus edulis TaxID=6550 RepID=A0A8S3QCZ4_MYTED|nr:unnamed protein product [Mytilus edulis]
MFKGNRPTIQGGLHYGFCPLDHYQPFHVVSNLTVGCALQKTKCSGEGQVVYEDNDPKRDTTCRCDYTKGYGFVEPPRNNCFCIPSQEDCTCYVKTCRNMLHVLDPDSSSHNGIAAKVTLCLILIAEHTAKRIQKHISDKTFFGTTAVEKGTTLLDSSHIMVLVGNEKCGKTEACLSICSSFKAKGFAVIYMTASNCFEAENMSYYVEKDKTELFVFDINMKPTEEDARNNLLAEANLYASENNKFIFTIKTSTGKRGLESFHQRQQVTMDCFTKDDKRGILMKHMQYNNIDECINYLEANYEDSEKLKDDEKIKIPRKVIDDIVEAETTGQFPELCKLFCSTRSLLPLEDRYFKNPSKSLIHDIHQLRSKTETKVLYVTLVYVLMKDTFDESEDQDVIKKSINTICEKMTIASYNPYDIKDAAIELVNKYIYLIEESGRFMFSNEWIKKAVWISYMDIDQKYCVMHCQWEYVSDLLRPNAWPKQNTDVCIRVNTPELTRRLTSEMKNTGSAWSVGTYLRKLSGNGKELTDAFCFDCMQTSGLEHKADTLLSFFNGISDLGKDVQVFSYIYQKGDGPCVVPRDVIRFAILKFTISVLIAAIDKGLWKTVNSPSVY